MALPDRKHWTEAEYLAFEQTSDMKHEYVDGKIVAMTGASWNHNLICVNTSTSLNLQLTNRDCRVTSNDMRLKVVSKLSYRYPDVMVVCGAPQFAGGRTDTITNPILIVEVLSETTALIDRNEKLDEYLQIDSLQEYVLISQDEPKIERYLRQPSGDWLYTQVVGLQHSIDLPSIGCKLALSDVYKKVTLTPEDASE
jgi:Uma2 family endonuclease